MKRRNPKFECLNVAQQISCAFGVEVNKDVARRILQQHYAGLPHGNGPSWITALAHAKDSLFSLDLFRCESIVLQNPRVLEVEEIKAAPLAPRFHPSVEHMIRTIREEMLDRVLFWNQLDLEGKLSAFRIHYNRYSAHGGIGGIRAEGKRAQRHRRTLPSSEFRWEPHCHGLFELPAAA